MNVITDKVQLVAEVKKYKSQLTVWHRSVTKQNPKPQSQVQNQTEASVK